MFGFTRIIEDAREPARLSSKRKRAAFVQEAVGIAVLMVFLALAFAVRLWAHLPQLLR